MKSSYRTTTIGLVGCLLLAALLLVIFDTPKAPQVDDFLPLETTASDSFVTERRPLDRTARSPRSVPKQASSRRAKDVDAVLEPLSKSLGSFGDGEADVQIQPGKVIAERLRHIKEQTAPARLNYNRPTELALGQQTVVVVGLTPLMDTALQAADERLAAELGVASTALRKVSINSTMVMVAELTGDGDAFDILPLHKNKRQAIVPGEVTEWNWLVTALRRGEHSLNLSISAVVKLQGAEEAIESSYTDRILVSIDPIITGRYLLNRYWLPLALVLLATGVAASGWLGSKMVFRRNKRVLSAALATEMPEAGQGYVFLSYSRRDERFAIPLARDLMKNGIRVWVDQREIRTGDNWVAGIATGIEKTDALLVVLSPKSVVSQFVGDEITCALQNRAPIFPILYRTCQLPEALREINAIDFRRDYPAALRILISDLESFGFRVGG